MKYKEYRKQINLKQIFNLLLKLPKHMRVYFITLIMSFLLIFVFGFMVYIITNLISTEKVAMILTLSCMYICMFQFSRYDNEYNALISSSEIHVYILIFIVQFLLNISKYDPRLNIPLLSSDIEEVNVAFLFFIAYTRVEKSHSEKKKRIEELNRATLQKGVFIDKSLNIVDYTKLHLHEKLYCIRCKSCFKYPNVKILRKPTNSGFAMAYSLEHFCENDKELYTTDLSASRREAIMNWNAANYN